MKTGIHAKPLLLQGALLMVLLASAGGMVPVILLFLISAALSSQLFSLAVLLVLVVLAWWATTALFSLRRPRAVVVIGLTLAAGLLAGSVRYSPSGLVSPNSHLTSVYKGSARFWRLSPTWLVDEADQVRLGGMLLPLVDPSMSREQGKQFTEIFATNYAQMQQFPDFVQIGSALSEAYGDMLLLTSPIGHMYVYHPESASRRRLPVLVFFHGWLGNMKAYVWAWSRLADRNGFVVICPSYGNGLWQDQTADEFLHWIERYIQNDEASDPQQVYIAGLSNGGTGVTRWASSLPKSYSGLVYISPVMEGTESQDFAAAVGNKPVLVVHGGADNRIPSSYVEAKCALMVTRGLKATRMCFEREDHVLVLSARERLQDAMLKWMNRGSQK